MGSATHYFDGAISCVALGTHARCGSGCMTELVEYAGRRWPRVWIAIRSFYARHRFGLCHRTVLIIREPVGWIYAQDNLKSLGYLSRHGVIPGSTALSHLRM